MLSKNVTLMCAALLAFAAPVHAANVLLLDDDYGTEVRDDLIAAGHTVTVVPYYDWNGTNPSLTGFDAVVLLKGYEYGYELGSANDSPAYDALIRFVENGGVFGATEWLAYDMNGGTNLALQDLVPFDYGTYEDYNYSGTYSVLLPGHPLATNLPGTWQAAEDGDGGVCIDLKQGATVVVARSMDYYDQECMDTYALAYVYVGSGISVHLNSDLGHEDDVPASPELLQIIRNIVGLTAGARDSMRNRAMQGFLQGIADGKRAFCQGAESTRRPNPDFYEAFCEAPVPR